MWPFTKKVRPITFYTGHIISNDQGELLEVYNMRATPFQDAVSWEMRKPKCTSKRNFV